MPLAKNAVAMSAMTISWVSVISITMTNDVMGDCNIPEKYPVIVRRIIAEAGATGNQCAKSAPSPAPVASEGTKIPEGIPLKQVNRVASILKNG